jgi:hypothetical protein
MCPILHKSGQEVGIALSSVVENMLKAGPRRWFLCSKIEKDSFRFISPSIPVIFANKSSAIFSL